MPAVLVSAWILLAALPVTAQEWFDALIARVEGQPVLISDVTTHQILFGDGVAYPNRDPAQREAALEALIDNRLLLAEAARFGIARPDAVQVSRAVTSVQQRLGARPAGLDSVELARWIRDDLWISAFVDARIRAFVMIRDAQVEETLARPGGRLPDESLDAARARVRESLAEQEAATRLARYLERLRRRAEVRRFPLPENAFPGG